MEDKQDAKRQPIVWSYSVVWEPSDVAWASRWDTYLSTDDPEIHWFSIINSLVTVLFLSGEEGVGRERGVERVGGGRGRVGEKRQQWRSCSVLFPGCWIVGGYGEQAGDDARPEVMVVTLFQGPGGGSGAVLQ